MLGAALRHRFETGADLHALDSIDSHHRVRNVRIQLVVQRLAPADRHVARHHIDARAAGIAVLAQLIHIRFHLVDHAGIRRKKRIVRHVFPGLERDRQRAELAHAAGKRGAVLLQQPLLGDGCSADHGRRQAC